MGDFTFTFYLNTTSNTQAISMKESGIIQNTFTTVGSFTFKFEFDLQLRW